MIRIVLGLIFVAFVYYIATDGKYNRSFPVRLLIVLVTSGATSYLAYLTIIQLYGEFTWLDQMVLIVFSIGYIFFYSVLRKELDRIFDRVVPENKVKTVYNYPPQQKVKGSGWVKVNN